MARENPFARYPKGPRYGNRGQTRKVLGTMPVRRRKRPPPVILTDDELLDPSFIYGTTDLD